MYLKKGIDPVSFLKCAQKCKGEVCFCTSAGDTLNLKSMLSEFLFLSAALDAKILTDGNIICHDSSDYILLKDYLEE